MGIALSIADVVIPDWMVGIIQGAKKENLANVLEAVKFLLSHTNVLNDALIQVLKAWSGGRKISMSITQIRNVSEKMQELATQIDKTVVLGLKEDLLQIKVLSPDKKYYITKPDKKYIKSLLETCRDYICKNALNVQGGLIDENRSVNFYNQITKLQVGNDIDVKQEIIKIVKEAFGFETVAVKNETLLLFLVLVMKFVDCITNVMPSVEGVVDRELRELCQNGFDTNLVKKNISNRFTSESLIQAYVIIIRFVQSEEGKKLFGIFNDVVKDKFNRLKQAFEQRVGQTEIERTLQFFENAGIEVDKLAYKSRVNDEKIAALRALPLQGNKTTVRDLVAICYEGVDDAVRKHIKELTSDEQKKKCEDLLNIFELIRYPIVGEISREKREGKKMARELYSEFLKAKREQSKMEAMKGNQQNTGKTALEINAQADTLTPQEREIMQAVQQPESFESFVERMRANDYKNATQIIKDKFLQISEINPNFNLKQQIKNILDIVFCLEFEELYDKLLIASNDYQTMSTNYYETEVNIINKINAVLKQDKNEDKYLEHLKNLVKDYVEKVTAQYKIKPRMEAKRKDKQKTILQNAEQNKSYEQKTALQLQVEVAKRKDKQKTILENAEQNKSYEQKTALQLQVEVAKQRVAKLALIKGSTLGKFLGGAVKPDMVSVQVAQCLQQAVEASDHINEIKKVLWRVQNIPYQSLESLLIKKAFPEISLLITNFIAADMKDIRHIIVGLAAISPIECIPTFQKLVETTIGFNKMGIDEKCERVKKDVIQNLENNNHFYLILAGNLIIKTFNKNGGGNKLKELPLPNNTDDQLRPWVRITKDIIDAKKDAREKDIKKYRNTVQDTLQQIKRYNKYMINNQAPSSLGLIKEIHEMQTDLAKLEAKPFQEKGILGLVAAIQEALQSIDISYAPDDLTYHVDNDNKDVKWQDVPTLVSGRCYHRFIILFNDIFQNFENPDNINFEDLDPGFVLIYIMLGLAVILQGTSDGYILGYYQVLQKIRKPGHVDLYDLRVDPDDTYYMCIFKNMIINFCNTELGTKYKYVAVNEKRKLELKNIKASVAIPRAFGRQLGLVQTHHLNREQIEQRANQAKKEGDRLAEVRKYYQQQLQLQPILLQQEQIPQLTLAEFKNKFKGEGFFDEDHDYVVTTNGDENDIIKWLVYINSVLDRIGVWVIENGKKVNVNDETKNEVKQAVKEAIEKALDPNNGDLQERMRVLFNHMFGIPLTYKIRSRLIFMIASLAEQAEKKLKEPRKK